MTRILLVCTGNICRSPVAEIFLRTHWAAESEMHISSAGTQAHVDAGIYSPMRKLLVDRGLPDRPFAARQLTAGLVEGADLVLVMTREHRSRVVVLHPPAVRRTFTLKEFARTAPLAAAFVTGDTVVQRLSSMVPIAARLRGAVRASAAEDAIKDPYGRGSPACLAALDEIEANIDDVARVLATASSATKS